MSDLKSKLPDLKEITGMMSKLFTDVKKSVLEIADEYKAKHQETTSEEETTTKTKPSKDDTPPNDNT